MPTLETKLNARSESFKANAQTMQSLVEDLRQKIAKLAEGGGEEARRRRRAGHRRAGRLERRAAPGG